MLNAVEAAAWDSYIRMTHAVLGDIGRALTEHTDLSMADHDVLCGLACAGEDSMRLGTLAEAMGWELSRLSHQLGRMQRRGLVARHRCMEDGRGVTYALTNAGADAIRAAGPIHDNAVRDHMLAALPPEDLRQLTAIATKVLHYKSEQENQQPTGGG